MKMLLKRLAVTFILGAALCVLASSTAVAIPITQWQCWSCNMIVFTFDPDSVNAQANRDFKDGKYQQKNWVYLSENGKAIAKCKNVDGGHIFDKTRSGNMNSDDIKKYLAQFIALKNGPTLKDNKLTKWKCAICKKEGYCFYGDTMDQYYKPEPVPWEAAKVVNFKNNSKLQNCNGGTLIVGTLRLPMIRHIFLHAGDISVTSLQLSSHLANVWYVKR
ncbi:MAG: hypothetical protein FWE49_06215 [Synergistaceae bacterium]|nr:hypothetical protein [Synergistaceae bacterium]